MANLKEAADKTLHEVEVEVRGIKVTVDKRLSDSFDFMMIVGRVQHGDILALQEVLQTLFGDNADEVLNKLRDDEGFLSMQVVNEFATEVLQAAGLKN